MAEPAEALFDVGNTDLNLRAEAEERARPLPERGPDGKFLPAEPAAVAPPAPAAPKHPDYLVRPALEAGLSQADVDEMSTPALGRWVELFNKQQFQASRQDATQRTIEQAMGRSNPPTPPAHAQEESLFDAELEKDLDPRLAKVLKKLAEENKELKALKGRQDQLDARETARQTQAVNRMIDDAFELLGPKYEKVFGKGDYHSLGAQSKEVKRRIACLQETGLDLNNTSPAKLRAKLQEAADTLYPVAEEAKPAVDPYAAAKPGRITPEQWNNGTVAKPTSRAGAPEPDGEAKAKKNLRDKMANQGMEIVDSEPGDKEILDGLLK